MYVVRFRCFRSPGALSVSRARGQEAVAELGFGQRDSPPPISAGDAAGVWKRR